MKTPRTHRQPALQDTLPAAESSASWQVALSQFDQIARKESQEKELLREQLRQAQEKSKALTSQFNDLHRHAEGVYREEEAKRQALEASIAALQEKISAFELDAKNTASLKLAHKKELEQSYALTERKAEELRQAQRQVAELELRMKKSVQDREASLSTMRRGADVVDSAITSFSDLFTSFETYLTSVEKNGITPITQHTGKMLMENWNIQRDNLVRLSGMLSELMEASGRIQMARISEDRVFLAEPQQAPTPEADFALDGGPAYNA